MGILDIFRKKAEQEHIDVDRDLKAIIEFFKSVNVKEIKRLYKEYAVLRKHHLHLRTAKASNTALRKSTAAQIRKYDKILRIFELFELDTGIASERAKKIAKALRIDAERYKVNQKLLNLVKTDEKWTFDW